MTPEPATHTYLVMTQQLPVRVFELVEAASIAEASAQGIVMLLVRSDQRET